MGILRIAYKLLLNDKARFAVLIIGIAFAVLLMVQIMSLFAGILQKSSSDVINIGAKVWVMDPVKIRRRIISRCQIMYWMQYEV